MEVEVVAKKIRMDTRTVPLIRRILRELSAPARRFAAECSRFSVGETLGLPYTFNPGLSLGEAILAVIVAFTRIFLGSVLFSLWGVAAWMIYAAIGNPILGVLAVLPIIALFAISMAALMLAISNLVDWIHRKLLAST